MIERDIRDLLMAINLKQQPLNQNTSLIVNYHFDRKKKKIANYYSVTVWEGKKPTTDIYYSRLEVLSALSVIFQDL